MSLAEAHTVVVASRAGVARIIGVAAIGSNLAVAFIAVLFVGSGHGQQWCGAIGCSEEFVGGECGEPRCHNPKKGLTLILKRGRVGLCVDEGASETTKCGGAKQSSNGGGQGGASSM